MQLREYLEELNKIIQEHPEVLEYEVCYSIDDEGNEYNKVNYTPSLVEFDNVKNENRDLQKLYLEDEDKESTNYNAIIIN